MLMLFPTIKVPSLSHIEIFRDNKDEYTFYALRNKPQISLDGSGNPQLSYYLFSRNADIAYASSENKELIEAQLGQLLMTCDLGITPEEHKIIVDYLDKLLQQEKNKFNWLYYKFLKKKRKPTRAASFKNLIKLTHPDTWKDGTATLEIMEGLGGTFKKASSSEIKPAMSGANSAAFYATFGVEGSELMIKALTDGYSEEGDEEEVTPLQAIIRYVLIGYAFVPNMEVHVSARNTQIHNFLQEYESDYVKKKRGYYLVEKSRKKTVRTDARSVYLDKKDISSIVEEMIDRKIVRMEITDFGDVGANSEELKEVENQIRTSVIDMVMTQMLPAFFQTAFIGDETNGEAGEGEEGGEKKPNAGTDLSKAEKQRPTAEAYYSFSHDVEKSKHVSVGFHFKKNGTVEFRRYPNGVIVTDMSPEEREKLIKRIDISSPEVQILNVQASVNADFEAGNIDSVIVNLKYSQRDHKTGVVRENKKSFIYRSGSEVNTFRVTMARDAENSLIDFYDVTAKLHYKNTSESPPEIHLENVSDRALVISYDKLGFVTVKCMAGDIEWSIVKEAIVDFKYLAEPGKPDTSKEVRLNESNLTGDWKCYMYGHKDKAYEYKVKYIYHDGSESEAAAKKATRDTIIIDDVLVGRVKASFDMFLDPNTVQSAKIEILYEDKDIGVKEEFSKWFEGSETWDWSMRLREAATDEFKYRHTVQYKDGLVNSSDWVTARSDEDVPPINLRRFSKNLILDAGLLDWAQWKIIYVTVSYDDSSRNYRHSQTYRLTSDQFMETFQALAFDNSAASFKYTLKMASVDGKITEIADKQTGEGVLMIKAPETGTGV
jgi:hypothetical protein